MTSNRPAVLMVTGAYFPEMSGAGLQCRALVNELRGAVQFSVLTTTTDAQLLRDDRDNDVPVRRVLVDAKSVASKVLAFARMTREFLRLSSRFSIVHLHGFSQKSMLIIALAKLTGKHVVIKLTSVGHDDPASMKRQGALAYWFYSRAERMFGVSPRFQVLYDASGLPRERFRLIPNGVDLQRFHPAQAAERQQLRRELGLPADAAMILFVGFFSAEKCPDVLFDAWLQRVSAGDRRSVVVFIGATKSAYYEVDEALAPSMRERARAAGVESRVVFVEATQEIERYQRAADIFVLPSVREGLPNALLEAMACGAGCIATRLPGVTDTLLDDGVSGLLIPPRDVDALTAALSRFGDNPDAARQCGIAAHARIVRDFSLAETGRRYLAAYQEVLAS